MSNNEIREKRKKVICDLVKDDFYVPMKEKELAMFLQVAKEDREEFREILRELLAEGKLTLTVKGKYMKSNGKVLTGTFISNAKGFGFVEVEGRDEDLFIPEDKQGGAFHKDTVEVALLPAKTGKRQEAQVIRIIARGMTQVVGTYEQSKSNFGFVIPDNTKIAQDIFVPKEWSKGAMTGHKVVVEITGYGTNTKSPEGKVVEILGHINDPGVDIMSIVRGFDLPVEFGEKIMNQVERVSQKVSEADCAGRRDLRDVTMVTIDGEDAKDLDDAVSVSFDGTYYHLGVHIADVTNYVQENSALDREALKRGTSVYLVDRVIPMLPHALSNGICSLNEGVDRLALSCLMKVDEEGEIVDYEICESVIRVNKRMSYTVVKKLLDKAKALDVRVCLDECFLDFVEYEEAYSAAGWLTEYPNLIILKSFTKMYAIPGLRLGYVLSADGELLNRMRLAGQPWSVSEPAQAAGIAALKAGGFREKTIALIDRERTFLKEQLEKLGFRVCDGRANYLCFQAEGDETLADRLQAEGILIRRCANYHGLGGDYYRTAVRGHEENEELLACLKKVL